MATKTIVTLVDDLTGEEGENVESVAFGLDGAHYEIDLDKRNADELRDVLAVYMENGRRVGRTAGAGKARRSTPARQGSGSRSREQSKAIREWAITQGIEVAERGRIPGEIVEKYDAANPR